MRPNMYALTNIIEYRRVVMFRNKFMCTCTYFRYLVFFHQDPNRLQSPLFLMLPLRDFKKELLWMKEALCWRVGKKKIYMKTAVIQTKWKLKQRSCIYMCNKQVKPSPTPTLKIPKKQITRAMHIKKSPRNQPRASDLSPKPPGKPLKWLKPNKVRTPDIPSRA